MGTRNPWQKLKDEAAKIRTPTQILQEQVGPLQDATGGLLRGRVLTKEVADDVRVSFVVYVPTLNNYAIELLRVKHPLVQYPALLYSDWTKRQVRCSDHERLETAVLDCLEAPPVQSIVVGLFAQTGQARTGEAGGGPGEDG